MMKHIYTTIIMLFLAQSIFAQKIEKKIVYFQFNKAMISHDYRATLDSIGKQMLLSPGDTLYLIGHTDSVGSAQYNKQLSEARVKAVTHYLVSKGINPERINIKYYGEKFPVANNDDENGRQLNRRVDVLIKMPVFICKYASINGFNQ